MQVCKNCLHDGVCYMQEVCNDIDEQIAEFGCNHFAVKEKEDVEIKIVVDRGMIRDVFATKPCDVEVIDLDASESCEQRDRLEDMVEKIRNSGTFRSVY